MAELPSAYEALIGEVASAAQTSCSEINSRHSMSKYRIISIFQSSAMKVIEYLVLNTSTLTSHLKHI